MCSVAQLGSARPGQTPPHSLMSSQAPSAHRLDPSNATFSMNGSIGGSGRGALNDTGCLFTLAFLSPCTRLGLKRSSEQLSAKTVGYYA